MADPASCPTTCHFSIFFSILICSIFSATSSGMLLVSSACNSGDYGGSGFLVGPRVNFAFGNAGLTPSFGAEAGMQFGF